MKLRHKTAIVVVGLIVLLALAASLFIAYQPDPRYDRQKVHPRLLSLQQPYKTVRTYYFMDGGASASRSSTATAAKNGLPS